MRTTRVVVYPFLIACYGVLALAAANVAEVVRLSDLGRPLLISLVVALVAWLSTRVASRDANVRALLTLTVVIWFSWYGYFQRAVAAQPSFTVVSGHEYAVPTLLIVLGALAYLIVRRFAERLDRLSRFLNITAAVLTLIPTATLLRERGLEGGYSYKPASRRLSNLGTVRNGGRPDVYLIILDKYTGARSLAANYEFDNRPFLDSLSRLGFMVPEAAHSNYVHTHLALAALLNWTLLEDRPEQLGVSDGALALDYAAIEDNRSWRFLRSHQYRFFFFPSAYPATARNRFADLELPDPRQVTSELEVVWQRNTVAMPFRFWWCRKLGCDSGGFPYTPAPPSLIDWKFNELAQLPDSAGPIFAFAHFTVPHEPYVFNNDCSHREPYWPRNYAGNYEPLVKTAYVEQIRCVNRKVLSLVSDIIARSSTPPIIILQADHGHGRVDRANDSVSDAGPERVNERTDIFAAYYLPGQPVGVVYDSITPVNVLPRIFNHYFKADIPLQPDATFWSTWDEPFKFTRIR